MQGVVRRAGSLLTAGAPRLCADGGDARRMRAQTVVVGGAAAVLGVAVYWRRNPSACPYSQRFWVEAPHPFITRSRLIDTLAPEAGERLLEVGPGTGYYTLEVAEAVLPAGTGPRFQNPQGVLDPTNGPGRPGGPPP